MHPNIDCYRVGGCTLSLVAQGVSAQGLQSLG